MAIHYPDNLPDIQSAKLPQVYVAAKQSLEQCVKIDECEQWEKKAEAMASYAKQAGDDSLYKMAVKIQSRAIQRCGQLLKALVPDAKPGPVKGVAKMTIENMGEKIHTGGHKNITLTQAAKSAGLSPYKQAKVLAVASIPKGQFDAMVESDAPPSIKQLMATGTKSKPKPLIDFGDVKPEDFSKANNVWGSVDWLFTNHDKTPIPIMLKGTLKCSRPTRRKHVEVLTLWINKLNRAMQKEWK
jgi:hypothetical protein